MTKDEVRGHARRFGLALHDKPESQDICFVPNQDYAPIVRDRRPDAFRPGPIRHVDGRVLGEHSGLAQFTIGQRRGVNVAVGQPVYVSHLDLETNTVTVGPKEALESNRATASRVNWLSGEAPSGPIRAGIKIRYQHTPASGSVEPLAADRVAVQFDQPQPAITPGQAMVFYQGEEVLGGAWIDS
jgi:tRNA-specific 2-thiouridylase